MAVNLNDFDLSLDDIRVVVRYAVGAAEEVHPMYAALYPEDERPKAAIMAARMFCEGAKRSNLQRTAAVAAHRAAKELAEGAAQHAAWSAGDAAAAAYLHPISRSTQVGHILRATAHAARASELAAEGNPLVGIQFVERASGTATPALVEILLRYPPAPTAKGRVGQLMTLLDLKLRQM